MGEHAIRKARDEAEARAFTRAVLQDIRALEALIARNGIETGITRIGVEQEMYLVGEDLRPAPCAPEVLAAIDDPRFTTELARFNMEANFDPQVFGGGFLGQLHADLDATLAAADAAARQHGARILLTGILPTLRMEDLGVANLTPDLRYQYLNEALFKSREAITVVIEGIDKYEGTFDSVVLEGANTSLQLHLQVTPDNGARLYNLMQLITAPLLAAATNSPVLLGQRLWHETRIAVFERSLDERSQAQLLRDYPTRVSFGTSWLETSVLEIFQDNAARFPVILTRDLEEDSVEMVAAGQAPKLAALALHNGTVWRWNRPCYGVAGGVAHLRIENRVLPAGPTIADEVANAALFYGMMAALPARYGEVRERLAFSHARENFVAAAHQGLEASFTWLDHEKVNAKELLLNTLIPAAHEGLAAVGVPAEQINLYLGIVEARVTSGQTGSTWLLNSFQAHRDREPGEVWRDAVGAMLQAQDGGQPVHEWELAQPRAADRETAGATVADIMTTDLFTLRPDDVIDLASSVMEWKHIRHIPVENDNGELLGVLTARDLLRVNTAAASAGAVNELMHTDLQRIDPATPLPEALELMLDADLGCLLVVASGKLLGIVTERDLLHAAAAKRL